jgi:hypothetical protein
MHALYSKWEQQEWRRRRRRRRRKNVVGRGRLKRFWGANESENSVLI